MAYDPDCYLCRAMNARTAMSTPTTPRRFVFTNDFAALRPDTSTAMFVEGLLRAAGDRGSCRVVCFSPRHDLTLGRMTRAAVPRVIDVLGGPDG